MHFINTVVAVKVTLGFVITVAFPSADPDGVRGPVQSTTIILIQKFGLATVFTLKYSHALLFTLYF